MNCQQCGTHILATMQIVWNGHSYHPDCIGDAVASKRATQERVAAGFRPEYLEAMNDEEPFEDEYTSYEDDDDLDDFIEHLDEMPDVSDEVLNQIPIQGGNGRVPDIITSHPYTVATDDGKVGTLISGMTTTLINREALKHLPVPDRTATFQPISHHELINRILECLSYRRLSVVREEYAVSPDGMKLFGLMELNVERSGVRFAIGLRNSNDKSMRIGLVAGYRVTVCENKMLTGDFHPLSAKHSKNFNLLDALSVGVDRIQRNIGAVEEQIEFKKNYRLDEEFARNMIYRAFLVDKFPMSLMRLLHREYFVAPSFEEFTPRTLWSLENAFTSCFKKLKPVQQFEATARLGKFFAPYLN